MGDTTTLRVITAGSVDDGKSTLIGRLLFESKAILTDQIAAIEKSRFQRTAAGMLDLSLLTDGLEAEREQGITIDVAYRYFNTAKRKFILADAPGHEQYTRNMVTGASTADVVVVLIDATRVVDGALLPQTKRHSAIARLLNVEHVVFAVNKLDLIGYDESVFRQIESAALALAKTLGLPTAQVIPLSALAGDNVTEASSNMAWYRGPALLPLLESLPTHRSPSDAHLRFPVQWVVRADGAGQNAFRGVAGRIERGSIRVGDTLSTASDTPMQARVTQILIGESELEQADQGRSVTIRFDREIDVSRGDILIRADETITLAHDFDASICWLDTAPFQPQRAYLLKHGTRTVRARIAHVDAVLDVNTLSHASESKLLNLNAIGRVRITAQSPLVVDDYTICKATGSFVLIDPATNQTAAAGMIRHAT